VTLTFVQGHFKVSQKNFPDLYFNHPKYEVSRYKHFCVRANTKGRGGGGGDGGGGGNELKT